ncbi:MAG TPA: hypothetical protein VLM79_29535 [Kofleriaceae bacterium]|nr:hypothetical protein [Kofleriaceae bacterium]
MMSLGKGAIASAAMHAAAVCAAILHGAACASTIEPAAPRALTPIAASAPSGMSLIWRNTELRPIRQPIAIGDVVIGIVASDRKTFIVSIDPKTGRMLWHQRISRSGIGGDIWNLKRVGDDKVAYLRTIPEYDEDSRLVHLVVADVRTGKEIARSPEAYFPSMPVTCANGRDLCAIADFSRYLRRPYRLDLATGDFTAESDGLLNYTRFLHDDGLVDLGDRPRNHLGLLRDGSLRWLIPASAAFPKGYSSDDGWHFRHYDKPHVFVGILWAASVERDDHVVTDLGSAAMAAISERTGEVLWRDAGSSFGCDPASTDLPVRCRQRGKLRYDREHDTIHVDGLDVTVEGFDLATGKTTWSLPLGPTSMRDELALPPAIAGRHQNLVHTPNGPAILDYATGTLKLPEPGATFWCSTPASYELSPPYRVRTAVWRYRRTGGSLAWICDASGKPAIALPSIGATQSVGACTGHYAVIATADGFLGFHVP